MQLNLIKITISDSKWHSWFKMAAIPLKWDPFQCRCCGRSIPNHRDRRVLGSAACRTTHDSLLQLLQTYLPTTTALVFYPVDISKPGLDKAYICKGCYNDVMKLVALKEKLHNIMLENKAAEETVIMKLKQSYSILTCTCESSESSPCAPNNSSGIVREIIAQHTNVSSNQSPAVVVTVGYQKRQRRHILHGTPKRVAKSLVRGNRCTVLKRLLSSIAMQKVATTQISKLIAKEIQKMCSDTLSSILREHSETALRFFSWETIILEIEKHAPLLFTILKGCLSTTPKPMPILCVIVSILLKCRNPKLCMVQSMISIILFAGHASKQVSVTL